jgi:hypothetical protein
MGPFNPDARSIYNLRDKMDVAPYDKKIMEETIQKIESMPRDKIETIVGRIPDAVIPSEGKQTIVDNLIEGQGKIRERMHFLDKKMEKNNAIRPTSRMSWGERRKANAGL